MAKGRGSGILTAIAEAERRRQREHLAQRRAWEAAQREHQRAWRASQRAAAGQHRAAVAAYQEAQAAEAARLTTDIENRIAALRGILAAAATAAPFHLDRLKTAAPAVAFTPGPLGRPVPPPDPARYQIPALSGLRSMNPAARREHDEQLAAARSRFEHDWRAAQAAEVERRRRLADFHRQHLDWVRDQEQRAAAHNAQVDELGRRVAAGEPDAVAQFFATTLYTCDAWPPDFPRAATTAWDPAARQLLIDWELPGYEVVPEVSRVRYVKAGDEDKHIPFPATQRAAVYRDMICQSCLRVAAEVFRADRYGHVASVSFNGYVYGPDPATGRPAARFLIAATIGRAELQAVHLGQVDAAECLTALRANVSSRPERLAAVRPGRRPAEVAGAADAGVTEGGADTDLHAMDPHEFEELVADLFRARGLQVMTTAHSGDGGVDVEAEDPDPITGGLIVIQVKRYRDTVPPSVVRDLYGVVQHRGATKGILVATSGFGPGSYEFAQGKPLTLIGGQELVGLLDRHGIAGHLGAGAG